MKAKINLTLFLIAVLIGITNKLVAKEELFFANPDCKYADYIQVVGEVPKAQTSIVSYGYFPSTNKSKDESPKNFSRIGDNMYSTMPLETESNQFMCFDGTNNVFIFTTSYTNNKLQVDEVYAFNTSKEAAKNTTQNDVTKKSATHAQQIEKMVTSKINGKNSEEIKQISLHVGKVVSKMKDPVLEIKILKTYNETFASGIYANSEYKGLQAKKVLFTSLEWIKKPYYNPALPIIILCKSTINNKCYALYSSVTKEMDNGKETGNLIITTADNWGYYGSESQSYKFPDSQKGNALYSLSFDVFTEIDPSLVK